MKKTVFYAGNTIAECDNKPHLLIVNLLKKYPGMTFLHYDPTEELPENFTGPFLLLDTVMGIEKVTCFNNLDDFALSPRVTPHDYDVLLNLKLLQKLGKLKRVTVIGIPQKGSLGKLLVQTENILKTI